MKKSEELNLSNQAQTIVEFAKKHSTLESFYKNIDSLKLSSIQDLSFENDIEFFRELSFILSVIFSIIAKPHINNKREEIIVRSGEAQSLTEEGFQKTLQDASVWKDKGNRQIVPEYLYHHAYEDELKIYENIFVVHMINELAFAFDHYSALYVSLLKVLDKNNDELVQHDSALESAMRSVSKLIRRMNQIKDSEFYRVVSRAKNKPKVFYPTNILVRDRLYNILYKFYKKMYVYDSKQDIDEGLYQFYFVTILSALKEKGFKVTGKTKLLKEDKLVLPDQVKCTSDEFNLIIELNKEKHAFMFTYQNNDVESKHLLSVTSDSTFQDTKVISDENALTTEYLSLWHLGESNGRVIKLLNETLLNEKQLVEKFIESHHHKVEGSERLYSTYCPSCKSRNIYMSNGFYVCPDCGVIYRFEKNAENHMVFLKVKGN